MLSGTCVELCNCVDVWEHNRNGICQQTGGILSQYLCQDCERHWSLGYGIVQEYKAG